MDPIISQALATFIGALTTAVLLASAYYWGPNRRDSKDAKKERRQKKEIQDEWESE